MKDLKIIFLGATKFSAEILNTLLENNFPIKAIFTIPENFNISYSKKAVKNYNYVDLGQIAKKNDIPSYLVDSQKGKKLTDYQDIIQRIQPDVILVMGWYYMVPKKIRNLAKFGAWGIHASLLPNYAGGAPLVWAIIEGQKETGTSLFRLEGGVDDGDIISQQAFPIDEDDTIKEVYAKATFHSKNILVAALKNIKTIQFKAQDKNKIKVYPQRSPKDGLIDWSWDKERVRNFIRAQSKPYPGAFTIISGKKIIIWDAEISEINNQE